MTLRKVFPLVLLFAGAAQAGDRSGPHPDAPPEMDQFAFLVGEWDCITRSLQQDGTYAEGKGRWVGYYTLDGYAFQDDFYGDGWRGTTWRTFHPDKKVWVNRWLMALTDTPPGFTSDAFYGRLVDGEMHIDARGESDKGAFLDRIRFYEIEQDSFRWTMDRSLDGGETWTKNVFMTEARRID